MKVVIAPDSFKESLPAADVAAALAEGVLTVVPDAQIDLCPMADGGEGTVEAMVAATAGRIERLDVIGPCGELVRAKYGLLGDGADDLLPGMVGLSAAGRARDGDGQGRDRAVIEMAEAAGLMLVPPNRRDPLRTTTYGVGQLIEAAMNHGVTDIVLGLGGSSTCDGGAGAIQALGAEFLDDQGEPFPLGIGGGALNAIRTLNPRGLDERLTTISLRLACDVTNPLLGPQGAAAVYAPQKGADLDGVTLLEQGLTNLANLLESCCEREIRSVSGCGAAGGLPACLLALAGATLQPGAMLIAEAVRLRKRLHGADICITGEGRLDGQSRFGKTPVCVQAIAAEQNVPTICIPGSLSTDAPCELFADVRPLVNNVTPLPAALTHTAELLAERIAAAMHARR
jgi:glycerate kinase